MVLVIVMVRLLLDWMEVVVDLLKTRSGQILEIRVFALRREISLIMLFAFFIFISSFFMDYNISPASGLLSVGIFPCQTSCPCLTTCTSNALVEESPPTWSRVLPGYDIICP